MIENGEEVVNVRMTGGPYPGNRIVPISKVGGKWPLADHMTFAGGRYVKIRQSDLTDEQAATMTKVCRGAEYKWEPAVS